MRINEIESKKVTVTLDSDELVSLSNIIYEYGKKNELRSREHDLAIQINIARSMCQYGHIDNPTLHLVIKHTVMGHPDEHIAKTYGKVAFSQEAEDI